MYNFEYKKTLGQNFLKDDNIINKIIDNSDIDSDTLVIEVGPGSGVLSKKILDRCGFAILYEIDNRLEKILDKELINYSNYKLVIGDFLEANVIEDIKDFNYKRVIMVANLPYYITTPIMMKIINDKLPIDSIVIMIQKEVANRYSSLVNSRDYGSITVLLNYYFDIKKLFEVSKNSFVPKPKVDSAVIKLVKKEQMTVDNEKFNKLIRDSFQFKRKNLKNNLKNYDLEKIEKILNKYNMNINMRAENIPVEIFIDIANNI